MDDGALSPQMLFSVSSALTVIGYLLYDVINGGHNRNRTSECDVFEIFLFAQTWL